MRQLKSIRSLILAFMLVFLGAVQSAAQVGHEVTRGDVYALGVVEVPGNTYLWKVFTDYTLTTEAAPQDVVFLAGNAGHQVEIKWMKSGTFYFTVTAFSQAGCMNLKVGLITVVNEQNHTPMIMIAVDRNPICKGTLATFTATTINAGYSPVFIWNKNGVHVGNNTAIFKDSALVDNDKISCTLVSSLKDAGTVTVYSGEITMTVLTVKAGFTFNENFTNMNGNIVLTNTSSGADYYYWDFGNGETSVSVNPAVTYTKDGTYLIMLTARNQINCWDTISYPYTMLFKGLYIPNAFVPGSSSQLGSVFKPSGIHLKNYRIEVYDSWGHLMWKSTALDSNGSPTEAWDGTCDGRAMPQGTYLWKVYATFEDETTWKGSDNGTGKGSEMGTVLLIR